MKLCFRCLLPYPQYRHLTKLLMVMKLSVLFFMIGCLQLSANGIAQTLSFTGKDVPIETVFKSIEKQSSYRFFYDNKLLKESRKVTINVKNASLKQLLDECLKDQPFSYNVSENTVVITKKKVLVDAFQPPIDIKGKVLDEKGQAVAGATIMVKGTNIGTTTRLDGSFDLKNIDKNATLIITGISITTKEIQIDGNSFLELKVQSYSASLEEVVVNKGYYFEKSRLSTGNVSQVNAETISKQAINNPMQALQGRVPGLFITQNSGVPGGSYNIEIRGRNSIASGNEPYYVIDGVPFIQGRLGTGAIIGSGGSPFNNLNAADIESIQILKDADATAIYGSRGANGVILITTKRGRPGDTRVSFDASTGMGSVNRKMELLSTEQYLEMRNEAFNNDGLIPDSNVDVDLMVWNKDRFTDWQDVLIGENAKFTNINSSISGGSANTQFVLRGGYSKETTVFPGDFSDSKGSIQFTITHKSRNNKFNTTFSGTHVHDRNHLLQVDLTQYAVTLPPNAPAPYDSEGKINWERSTWNNPMAEILKRYKANSHNMIGSLKLSYDILKNLGLEAGLGYSGISMDEIQTQPLSSLPPAIGATTTNTSFASNENRTWIIEPKIHYKTKIGMASLNVLVGGTLQQDMRQGLSFTGFGYNNDALLEDIKSASTIQINNTISNKYKYAALFGRLNYTYKNRYIINVTGRRDGSSRFGPNRQFGTFGAIGMGWIFTDEPMLHKLSQFLTFGKVKASYGTSGNDQIPDYGFLDFWRPSVRTFMGVRGLVTANLLSPDYGWEINRKFEASLELGFFQDVLSFIASYYHNRSSNQLVGYSLPATTGFPSINANREAVVQNTGVEIEVSSINLKQKRWSWITSFNITVPRNRLVSYPEIEQSSEYYSYKIGSPLNIILAYQNIGVDSETGIYQFASESGIPTNNPSFTTDRLAIIDRSTKYYGGLRNTLTFANFELDFFFQFVKKVDINYMSGFTPPGMMSNQPNLVMNRWRKPGDISTIQKFSQSYGDSFFAYYSSAFNATNGYSDASYIRLRSLSLSYIFPQTITKRLRINSLKLFALGQNLWTSTNYSGLDPETVSSNTLPTLNVTTVGIKLEL